MLALNQTNVLWPPYASHMIFEIEKNSHNQPTFVNVKSNDQLLPLPACGNTGRCTWSQFQSFMMALTPSAADCAV